MRAFAAYLGQAADDRIVVLAVVPAFGDDPLYVYVNMAERVILGRGTPLFVAFLDTSEEVLGWLRFGTTP